MMDPLTAIGYLQLEYQSGFRFSLGSLAPDIGPDVREIDLLPIAARGRTASQARVWVSESTGEVFKTELRSGFGARAQTTTTTFSPDPILKVRVPRRCVTKSRAAATTSSASPSTRTCVDSRSQRNPW